MRTRLATASVSALPERPSTTAMPVMTSCSRARRRRSIPRAVSASAGLPGTAPPTTTMVSAPRITPSRSRAATARALSSARRATAWGSGPGVRVSSISAGTTWNSAHRELSNPRRLGEAEARTRIARPLRDDQRVGIGHDAGLRVDGRPDVLGEIEGVLMGVAVPVGERALDPVGNEPIDRGPVLLHGIDLLGGRDEPPRRPEARDEGLVAPQYREDVLEGPVDGAEDPQLADLGHAGLHGHGAAGREPVADQRVELLGEEQTRRALFQGLDQVDADEVEALARLLEISPGILVTELGPGVLERPLVHLGQVLLAEVDHLAVDVDHDGVGHRGV